jgi:hypothetical protein
MQSFVLRPAYRNYDGETRRVRSGDGAIMLRGRRLTVHLMVQPDVAGMMLNDRLLADQGLLSRFLITAPDSVAGLRPWHEPSPASEIALKRYDARNTRYQAAR